MTRTAMLGAAVFGLVSALAGYLWVAFEFPFAILLPAFVGWFVVARTVYPTRKALIGALVGGVGFTAVLIVGLFFAITDGSPVGVPAWLAAVLAAAVAGALTGAVLDRRQGALTMAVFSAVGMLVSVAMAGLIRTLSPVATDMPGPAQNAWAALMIGVVGVFVGAAIGAGVAYLGTGTDSGDAQTDAQDENVGT